MGWLDEYNQLKANRQNTSDSGSNGDSGSKGGSGSSSSSWLGEYNKLKANREHVWGDRPVGRYIEFYRFTGVGDKTTVGSLSGKKEEKKKKWFEKGLFEDGYDFGDITKTILGTAGDVMENIGTGIAGMGEKVVDAGAYLSPYIANGQFYQNGGMYIPEQVEQQDKIFEDSKKDMSKFIAKDLYDEEAVVKGLVTGVTGVDVDDYSSFGEKSDALVQSGGQLLATAGLQAVGVPWFVTTGATSFGSEAENALNQGATYGQAGASAAISAGAEILSEKLSGGISFGGKTLDDALTKQISRGISNKMGRTFAKLGIDMAGEGAEEIFSQVASNLGSSLYKEESLEELLLSEESMDEYLESFIGGAVLGGVSGSYNAVKSNRSGVDYASGLTENEQKVVDKVYKDRVDEAEKSGNVTQKQKSEIYDKVLSDMDKGYILTDTIEEVLGGDSYSSYKETVDREDAILKEYEELGEKPNATPKDYARYTELTQQVNDIRSNSRREALRAKLDEDVMGIVQGSRLAESYNERTRRSQKFEADVTKYDAKQQAVIQKAIDSGILNNTNRTHEFVDIISKISADKGVLFDFTNNAKLKESGFAIDGKQVNGFVTKDGISLNIDSPQAWQKTVGHEVTHVLEGTEFYTELQKTLFDYAEKKGELGSRFDALKELYKDIQDADVNAELTADLVGEYLFTDENFIKNLSTEHRNVFQKIYDEIKYLYKAATGSKEAKELEKVKRAFDKAYKEAGNGLSDTKYSISETTDGRFAAVVDNDILSSIDTSSWDDTKKAEAKKAASDALKQFSEGIVVDGITRKVNKVTRREYTRSNYTESLYNHAPEVFADKMRAADVADDIVIAATNWNRDGGLKHPRTDNFIDFDHGKTLIVSGDAKYSAEVVVGITDAGEAVLYDVVDMTPTTFDVKKEESPTTATTQNAIGDIQGDSFNTKVAQKGNDVKYSLSDSNGKQLTKEQQDYFKDSKVRDDNGSLKVMYHGTPNGDFTVFKDGTYFTDSKEYADIYQNPSASSISTGKVASNPKTFEVYLDIKKPFDINDAEARNIYINDYIKGGNAMGINPYLSDAEYAKINSIDWTEGEDLREFLIENEYDYDGLVLDEGATGGYGDEVQSRGKSYVVFSPEQVKNVDNASPTSDPDIRNSLSDIGEQHTSDSLSALRLETDDVAPVAEKSSVVAEKATEAPIYESKDKSAPEGQTTMFEPVEEKKTTRKEYHQSIIDNIKDRFDEKGFDFDKVLKGAKNLSTWSTVDNTPQRVMEKALGYKEGGILADITVNKVAQNETEGIKWLNSYVDQLKQISKQYHIKPGSKESAAAQMFAEGFYVNENNEIVRYGEPELIQDFKDPKARENIKRLARDPRIRKIYDDTLAMINESRTRNLYPEIPRLDNYFLHFRAMNDTFSTLGLPFNPNDIRAKDLPTDLNGVTADLKPGQPYFASANHRTGKRTSFDMLGGIERYLTSAKNQIYHIDDIQTLRALRNYIAETYGQATGLEDLDTLSDAEAEERIKQVYGSHLSTFAKFLNEEANVLAGKTALIDRGLEGIIGRRGITFLNTLNGQVGSNMVGYNISSSLTNFLPVAQTFAKSNKFDFIKAFGQTALNKLSGGRFDAFAEDSPVVIRRKGEDRFYRTPWQKIADPGYALMGMVDDVSTEIIARTKYNEFTRKGMDSQKAHFETDKWVSKLMGDRSLGQQPQLYNSKMLGLITKFQLEVRNQLDAQFYDTIQETKASNEHIQNGLARNVKTAAQVASTFTQLAVAQHLFGKAFESVAGYNPAFDIIEVLATAFGFDDDEESEDTALDNFAQGLLALAEDMPYASTFTGGRIPISDAIPDVNAILRGEDEYGNEIGIPQALVENVAEIAPYYLMPAGYGQAKKTIAGLKMFSDEHPIAGSYTDAGNLRFPVEDTLGNKIHAGIFGQYASENARKYFDEEQRTLNADQTEIFAGLDIPIEEYWEYRDNLYDFYDVKDELEAAAKADGATDEDILKGKYIKSVYSDIYDLYDKQKEIAKGNSSLKKSQLRDIQKQMSNMLTNSKYAVGNAKISGNYAEVGDRRYNYDTEKDTWYEIKAKNADGSDNWYYQKEQEVTKGLGISYEEYWSKPKEYNYAYDKPGRYAIAKTIGGYETYMEHYDALENWQSDNYIASDKDSNGNSISGSRKKKVQTYIDGLDLDYGEKIILYRTVYSSKKDKRAYNQDIIDYLNERSDISYEEKKSILEELEMEVDDEGYISW